MIRTRAVNAPRRAPRAMSYDEQVQRADLLRRQGSHAEARRAFHDIALAHPDRSDAFSNLAGILQATGHPVPALQAASRALELDPTNVSALINSAEILKDFGDWDTVAATYDAALALQPASPTIRFARALHLLTLGHWSDGWREHEQRQLITGLPLRRTTLTTPVWDGSPLEGRHILLDHEQGLGDQIMFARFAEDVAQRGGRVTIRCSAPLASLFAGLRGVQAVSIEGSAIPAHDVHASLMSLPALLGIESPDSLRGAPYLQPVGSCPPAIAESLQADRLLIGIEWAGNRQHRNDARRSIAPALLMPLLAVDNVQLVSLHRHEEGALLPAPLRDHAIDVGPWLDSFSDTAHALMKLDLLVTVDTSVAHLAGALGVPTLLLVPFVPDWRWMVQRTDTPWYRSVQLLRQPALFEWTPLLETVAEHLRTLGGTA